MQKMPKYPENETIKEQISSQGSPKGAEIQVQTVAANTAQVKAPTPPRDEGQFAFFSNLEQLKQTISEKRNTDGDPWPEIVSAIQLTLKFIGDPACLLQLLSAFTSTSSACLNFEAPLMVLSMIQQRISRFSEIPTWLADEIQIITRVYWINYGSNMEADHAARLIRQKYFSLLNNALDEMQEVFSNIAVKFAVNDGAFVTYSYDHMQPYLMNLFTNAFMLELMQKKPGISVEALNAENLIKISLTAKFASEVAKSKRLTAEQREAVEIFISNIEDVVREARGSKLPQFITVPVHVEF